ncbi:hypothetical protein IFR05_001378 [Cadophora sp. M221]|nr:hypothetical protein IFR05_001378 [Cadophora sp. M221]
MTKAKHDDESAERIARSRGENSREAKSAARAAKHNKSNSQQSGGESASSGGGGGSGSGGGGGGSDGAWECPNRNRSGGRCSTWEPCVTHIPSWRV